MHLFIKSSNKKNKDNNPKAFLEKLAFIDYERVYTTKVRVGCHCLMWAILTVISYIGLHFGYGLSGLSVNLSIIFSLRNLMCNVFVFYFFFYIIVPNTLLKGRIIFAILFFPLCIVLWMIINHYFMIIISRYFMIKVTNLREEILRSADRSISYLLLPRVITTYLMSVVSAISPPFFIKITFNIARYYSKWFKSEKRANQLEVEKLGLEMEKLNLERDFLKSQLNPHFLFNTLNNLYGMAARHDPMTPQSIADLTEMMRYTLYQSSKPVVPLAQELAFLKNYISMEKMRHEAGAPIACCIHDEEVDSQVIAPLLTFIFVENAFKYGLKSENGGFVKITVSVNNNIFNFTIVNDKENSSSPKERSEFEGGIGIQNVRKRLKSLYREKHQLTMENRGDSFFVNMSVDLT